MAKFARALYGLPKSGQNWHYYLADILYGMGFTLTKYDNNIWMTLQRDKATISISYNDMGCHMDDLMIVAEDAQLIMDQRTAVYEVAKPAACQSIPSVVTTQKKLWMVRTICF